MTRLVYVGKLEDMRPGSRKLVNGVDRVEVLVMNYDGRYFAVSNICPHKGARMCEGVMKGQYLECPWHMAKFRVEDGRGFWPATRGLRVFPVKVDGDSVYIESTI